jgi:hypothetical protein
LKPYSWCILSHRSRSAPDRRVHPILVIPPPSLSQLDIPPRNRATVLTDDVEQHKQVLRAAIQDPVRLAATVAAQLAQSSLDLRGSREGERRETVGEPVQFSDLVFDLGPRFEVEGSP